MINVGGYLTSFVDLFFSAAFRKRVAPESWGWFVHFQFSSFSFNLEKLLSWIELFWTTFIHANLLHHSFTLYTLRTTSNTLKQWLVGNQTANLRTYSCLTECAECFHFLRHKLWLNIWGRGLKLPASDDVSTSMAI